MTVTIEEQQQISAILTGIIGLLAAVTGSAVFTGNSGIALASIGLTVILGIVNHFQTATTTVATA